MGPCRVKQSVWRERYWGSSEDLASKLQEWNHQYKLQGVNEIVAQLRGCDVEPEQQRYCQAENRRAAEQRIDADG